MAGVKTVIVNAFARQYTPCRVSLQRCRGQWTIHHHGPLPPTPLQGHTTWGILSSKSVYYYTRLMSQACHWSNDYMYMGACLFGSVSSGFSCDHLSHNSPCRGEGKVHIVQGYV